MRSEANLRPARMIQAKQGFGILLSPNLEAMPPLDSDTAQSGSPDTIQMKNLEQIRARNAEKAAGVENFSRNDVNGLPALVRSCGLLATAAFVSVVGQSSRTGMWNAMDAVAKHLLDPEIGRLTRAPKGIETGAKIMLKELSDSDSSRMIAATSEAIAYLHTLNGSLSKNEHMASQRHDGRPATTGLFRA